MSVARRIGPPGRVTTVLAAKSGCGKTTLATNLAALLGAGGVRSVCLVDLDLAFGDVANMLDIEPQRTLADGIPLTGSLHQSNVHTVLTTTSAGFDCVLAPTEPGEAEQVPVALIGKLLTKLSWLYDHVVVDTSAHVTVHTLAALDHAHQHVLLTAPDRPALSSMRRTLDMLDMLPYDRIPRHVVLNRCDSRIGLETSDIEEVLKHQVAAELPFAWEVTAAVNIGVPLAALRPDHQYTEALRRFIAAHIAAPRFSRDPQA
ncbi:AAA family ATPase [Actinophytocola sp.]|uniref:AAA family ATPase n=1 Tax=Actinophytocola sp. TaxID=1872138 RepID=UPI002ED0022C